MRVMGISLFNSASGRTLTMIVFSSTTTFSTSARTTERYRKTVGATEYFSDASVRRARRWRSKNTRSRQPFCGSARSFAQRVGVVRALVEKVVVDEKTIIVKVRPDALLNRDIPITRIGGPKRQYY